MKKDTNEKIGNFLSEKFLNKIGNFLSEKSLKKTTQKISWWEVPTIYKHYNHLICGKYVDGFNKGLIMRIKELGLTFEHGVSVGFESGQKEFEMIKEGIVKKFTLFEFSNTRIEMACELARKLGFEDKVNFVNGDFFNYSFAEKVDFVHWDNSLHQMFSVDEAVKWSYQILEPEGVFYMTDYVGPSRFQWSDDALELCTRIRNILPDIYLKDPNDPSKLVDRIVSRPDAKKIEETDPNRAADSSRILEVVNMYFPNAEVTLTGGTVYHAGLNDILCNFDEYNMKDKAILNLLLIIDELATKSGIESHYATVLGKKPAINKNKSKIEDINATNGQLNNKNKISQVHDLLLNSELFDTNWYKKKYGFIDLALKDPVRHYLEIGAEEGCNPSPLFDSDMYLHKNPDVKAAKMNPLLHYIKYGRERGRKRYSVLETSELNRMIPNLKILKKSLRGKNGYLFLVNDSNAEIEQHFNEYYENKFSVDLFFNEYNSKNKFCIDNNIKYYFFIVPDKSLVCKEFLPFDVKTTKRNYNLIKNAVPDFIEKLNPNCYFRNDSHINYIGGKELSYHYLNHIFNFGRKEFDKLINEQISANSSNYNGDLTSDINFSYSDEEKKEYLNEKIIIFKNKYLVNLTEDIPEKFKFVGERKTEYYANPEGFTNLKALILRDSSVNLLKHILSIYFGEILLYWDHWSFNKKIVEWYKPDILLEIRTERFLEKGKFIPVH